MFKRTTARFRKTPQTEEEMNQRYAEMNGMPAPYSTSNSVPAVQPTGAATVVGPNTRAYSPRTPQLPVAGLVAALGSASLPEGMSMPDKGPEEYATPISRAIALLIKELPFTIVWIILSVGLTSVLNLGWQLGLLAFAAMTAVSFYMMMRQEHRFSAAGIELKKVEVIEGLTHKVLDQNHERAMLLLNHFVGRLDETEEEDVHLIDIIDHQG